MQSADNAAARTSLGLGTAATSAAADFATAAQGATADTAVQPGDLGGAAALNVGTAAGTVAAGDHTHGDATTLSAGFMAATDKSKLDGIEIGADVTDAGNVAAAIAGAAGKTTPVDADALPLIDSAASNALKKLTWANLKAALKSYFDSLYALATHTHAAGDITSGTLDAARLPVPTTTALGGVKRNTGTAGQFVTGIDSGGGLTYDTPAGVGSSEVVQVEVAMKTDTQTTTANNDTWTDITDLAITVTTTAGQRVVIHGAIQVGAVHATSGTAVRLVRAGSPDVPINAAATTSGRWSAGAGPTLNSDNNVMMSLAHGGIDTPGAGTWTYKYQFCASSGSGSATAYINRSSSDTNTNPFSSRAASFMRLEVLAP